MYVPTTHHKRTLSKLNQAKGVKDVLHASQQR